MMTESPEIDASLPESRRWQDPWERGYVSKRIGLGVSHRSRAKFAQHYIIGISGEPRGASGSGSTPNVPLAADWWDQGFIDVSGSYMLFPQPAFHSYGEPLRDRDRRSEEEKCTLMFECQQLKSVAIANARAALAAQRRAESAEQSLQRQLDLADQLLSVNRSLQTSLLAKTAGQLCLHEAHLGTVSEALGDEIAVEYENGDGPIEQVYERTQFVNGQLPTVGDVLEAHVFVVRRPAESQQPPTKDAPHEFRAFREKGVSGPIEI